MRISPDSIVYAVHGWFQLNATMAFTWLVMALMVLGSWLVTRRLREGERISRWQNLLEVLVGGMRREIREVARQDPDPYLPFVGTLFLFILVSNLLGVIPGFQPPTGSLSTTTALAIAVFVAVPIYGVQRRGVADYLRQYLKPNAFMLPFNIIGEFSRTLALAVRLYGNIMSGTLVAGLFLALAPFFFPVLMHAMGLLTGAIQAYIFAILAMVYIAAAARERKQPEGDAPAGEAAEKEAARGKADNA